TLLEINSPPNSVSVTENPGGALISTNDPEGVGIQTFPSEGVTHHRLVGPLSEDPLRHRSMVALTTVDDTIATTSGSPTVKGSDVASGAASQGKNQGLATVETPATLLARRARMHKNFNACNFTPGEVVTNE